MKPPFLSGRLAALFIIASTLTVTSPFLLGEPAAEEANATADVSIDFDKRLAQVTNRMNALIKAKDVAGLEAYATELQREKSASPMISTPLISRFYGQLGVEAKESEKKWTERKALLEQWLAAYPDSIAAHTALIDWYIGYAWKARGTGFANTVTEEGWKLMKERLAQAKIYHDAVMAKGNEVDVVFYSSSMSLGLGQRWPFEEIIKCLELGRKIDPNHLPLYTSTAYFLTPKWHGERGDIERFATAAASYFDEEEGDYLFARINTYGIEHGNLESDFFVRNPGFYQRMKRGFEAGILRGEPSYGRYGLASSLCHMAMLEGDYETAKALFLNWGARINSHRLGGEKQKLQCRVNCGAQAEIDRARALENEGKLEEAEALYRSFSPYQKDAYWLPAFYLRQGMKAPYVAIMGEAYPENLDSASLNDLANATYPSAIFGDWKTSVTAATKFDDKRPWNLTGLGVLFLDAARTGDKAKAQSLKEGFLARKVERPAFKNAQAIVGGTKPWAELAPEFHKQDGFSQQAAIVVIGWFLCEGNVKEAQAFLEAVTPATGLKETSNMSAMLESLRFGVLHRALFKGGGEAVAAQEKQPL